MSGADGSAKVAGRSDHDSRRRLGAEAVHRLKLKDRWFWEKS